MTSHTNNLNHPAFSGASAVKKTVPTTIQALQTGCMIKIVVG
jgi:hypothetical protein